MGMFDSLYVICPECKNLIEFQSKAGCCCLQTYSIDDCPPEVLIALKDESGICPNCSRVVTIKVDYSIKAKVE